MKATGVIRRIDELGRIVIPKEIRKTLRIKDGENLEIFTTNNNEIILKKFSFMNKLEDFAQQFTDAIYGFSKHNIIITDNSSFIAFSGPLKKEYINKEISSNLEESIKRREEMLEKHRKDFYLVDDKKLEGTYAISSINSNGDTVGLVIIFDENEQITETEYKISQIAANFLAKYLEE